MKKQKGITLIILVITIVVIVILGGSSIYLIIGQQGTVNKVSEGRNKYSESEIKEKIEMAIMDIQMQESKKGNELAKKAIIDNIEEKIGGLIINDVELMELYYENYLIEIDDEFKVKVTKTNGIIPIIKYTLSTKEKNVNSVDVTINARINDSKGINKIILPDNTQVEADIASYTIDVNGKYEFRVIANNGNEKKCIINITNIIPKIVGESISDILEKDIPDGNNIFLIKGSTDKITKETKEYNVEIINYNEDVQYSLEEGQTTRTIKLGDETSEKKMLIVKYNKNLTIDKGVTLTANTTTDTINNTKGLCCKKGMYIYVNQTLTNNGLITMTARGTVNEAGENVYLWKNTDNSYEYIPAVGGAGAGRVKRNTDGLTGGATGGTGTNRRTGGGGSGAASRWATATSYSGAGAAGTSYSGGTGGGGCSARLGGTFYGGNGAANGGAGGAALTKKENSTTYFAGGGAGNPGGNGSLNNKSTTSYRGSTGTGGLLIIYANNLINNSQIISNGSSGGGNGGGQGQGGSSGGGSINIFYKENYSNLGTITSNGGARYYSGGLGGTGSVTIGNITSGSFIKN